MHTHELRDDEGGVLRDEVEDDKEEKLMIAKISMGDVVLAATV